MDTAASSPAAPERIDAAEVDGPGEEGASEPVLHFVHVMKAAGTSMVEMLKGWFGQEAVWPYGVEPTAPRVLRGYVDPWELARGTQDRLETVRVVCGHHPFAAVELSEGVLDRPVVSASVLRDPVDRVVSLLRNVSRLHPEHAESSLEEIYDDEFIRRRLALDHQTKVFSLTPDEIVDPPDLDIPEEVQLEPVAEDVALLSLVNDDTDWVMGEVLERHPEAEDPTGRFGMSQYSGPVFWDIPSSATRLESAMINLESVDVLGVADQLDQFTEQLAETFELPGVESIPQLNSAPTPDRDDVAWSLRRRIAAENARDIALYEHALELVERRTA